MNYVDIENVSPLLMERLKRLTEEGVIHTDWVDNIENYGLLWEVTLSSGLTGSDVLLLNDEDFLQKVNCGMVEWDI